MKARSILTVAGAALLLPAYLGSCAVDRWAAYADRTASDRWIDDTMRVWYYWKDSMPNTNDLNYFSPPFDFFASVLCKDDGQGGTPYSTIDSLQPGTRSIPYTDYSYGFQFTTRQAEDNDTALYAHVLYVAPGSPADGIGLQRGDWLLAMDGQPITESNQTRLYGSGAMQLTVGYYDAEDDTIRAYDGTRDMASACPVDDNPVHHYSVVESGAKRVGYLVYNHFSAGPTQGSTSYDDDLRAAFAYFASQQVGEFVLDLRYNNGGLLSSAELLCTMLAPASALGQELGYAEFNSDFPVTPFRLDESRIGSGANLNLSTLYVLTSGETASASEMLVNCLKPYMDVVVVGATTVGKNVGSMTFTSPELMLTMSPIVCKLFNAQGESDYASGFPADVEVDENSDMAHFLPFGNPQELMLGTALGLIEGNGSLPPTTDDEEMPVVLNSVARRASKAVDISGGVRRPW